MTQDERPTADAVWLRTVERLLRGLAHALSNRIGAVAAVAAVLEPGDDELLEELRAERQRMTRLVALQRLLVREPAEAQAAHPLEAVLADVHALATLDVTGLEGLAPLPPLEGVPPVRVHRTALVHALVLLLLDGRARASRAVSAEWDDARVRVRLAGAVPPADAVAVARTLAAADGGEVVVDETGAVLSLPTLAALRRDGR